MWPFVCLFSFQWLVCLHNSLTPARILELGIESNLTWRSNNLETFGFAAEARPGPARPLTWLWKGKRKRSFLTCWLARPQAQTETTNSWSFKFSFSFAGSFVHLSFFVTDDDFETGFSNSFSISLTLRLSNYWMNVIEFTRDARWRTTSEMFKQSEILRNVKVASTRHALPCLATPLERIWID